MSGSEDRRSIEQKEFSTERIPADGYSPIRGSTESSRADGHTPVAPQDCPVADDALGDKMHSQNTAASAAPALDEEKKAPANVDVRLVEEPTIDAKQVPKSNRKNPWLILQWWWLEILSSVGSVATLLATALVLNRYNGKTISSLNLPTGLTLNGLLAALSTINRALLMTPVGSAMMQELWLHYASKTRKHNSSSQLRDMNVFDSASRGVWGSFVFLYWGLYYAIRRKQSRLLAILACVVTIVSLGFSTFTQQLVTFDELKPVEDSRLGNLPRSELWSDVLALFGGADAPPREVVAALYDGVLTTNVEPVMAGCPSGNCTWPPTPTLGVCGECTELEYTRHCYMEDFWGREHYFCNYTLPNGNVTRLWDFDHRNTDNDNDNVGYAFEVWGLYKDIIHYSNATGRDYPYLGVWHQIGVPPVTSEMLSTAQTESHVTASECALWACIQLMNGTVHAAEQNLNTVATSTSYRMEDASGLGIFEDTILTHSFPQTSSESEIFNLTDPARSALEMFLHTSFTASVTRATNRNTFSTDLAYGIWNGTQDLPAFMNNVATSLSNVMRTQQPSQRPKYNGQSYELGVTIRWNWIVLPAVLVALSIGLLVAVMIKTALSPVEAWKGSPLMFLVCDTEDDIREASCGHLERPGGLERAVGGVAVRLGEVEGKGWKFKAA